MNILMITGKIDREDALAGFAYGWVKRIAEELKIKSNDQQAKLFVICSEKGNVNDLPDSAEIFSLGKEVGVNRYGRLVEFQKLARTLVPKSDGVFCHVDPGYTIRIWPYAKFFQKKIVTWYSQGSVNWKVRLMLRLADTVLTATEDSLRVSSKKKKVAGYGIDIETFRPSEGDIAHGAPAEDERGNILKILTVGRISPAKDLESIIKALYILQKKGILNIRLMIVGTPVLSRDFRYFESLRQMVRRMGLEEMIEFTGPVPNKDVVRYYQDADMFINLSASEKIDQSLLEAMACECVALTSNPLFSPILPKDLIISKNNPGELADRILWVAQLNKNEKTQMQKYLRSLVVENHNLDTLIKTIISNF